MKKILLLICVFTLSFGFINVLKSQSYPPALGAANFPKANDTVTLTDFNLPVAIHFTVKDTSPTKNDTVSIDRSLLKALNNFGDTSFINLGTQKGYQNWVFSLNLYAAYGTPDGHHYKTPKSGVPGYNNFRTSNLYFQEDTTTSYFLNNSKGFYEMGTFSSAATHIINQSLYPLAMYPVTYKTPVNYKHTLLTSNITSGGSTSPIQSSLDINVQAYGKISVDTSYSGTPSFVTYDSCYLVVSREMDSISYASLGFPGDWQWSEYKIYSIYSPRMVEPVVSFQYYKNRNNLYSLWSSYPSYAWSDLFMIFYASSSAVLVPATGIFVSPPDTTVKKGSTFKLTASLVPSNAYPSNIVWATNNGAYATVDQTGKVTCIRAGSAVITAKAPGGVYSATCNLTITSGIQNLNNTSAFNLKCYPNPVTQSATISYELTDNSLVNISIYNMLGEKVANPVNSIMDKGKHQVKIDASNLPGGIYYYKIQAGNNTETGKMMVIK